MFKKEEKKTNIVTSNIAASILSTALSIAGFSKLKLELWWHFGIAAVLLFVLFCVFYILIEIFIYIYDKYIKRANIRTDINTELLQVENLIDLLYNKEIIYTNTHINAYSGILLDQILSLYNMINNKIKLLEEYSDSSILKHNKREFILERIDKYKLFCEYINKKHCLDDRGLQ